MKQKEQTNTGSKHEDSEGSEECKGRLDMCLVRGD